MAKTIPRVVLDPTVVVEALLEPAGGSALLLRAAASQRVRLIWSEQLRAKLELALFDEEVREVGSWTRGDAGQLIDGLEVLALEVDSADAASTRALGGGLDPWDDVYFSLALEAAAVVASTDPRTLARSGHFGVEVLRPETLVAALPSL